MSRIAKRQPWRSLSQQGSSSAIRSSSLPIPTINTRIYPTTPVSGISIGSGRPFSTSFGRLVEQGPTKPPPLPPAGLNKPLEGKTKNVESRQKKKDEDEDGEVQTPVPSPLNIPGGGIPGFGHTFTNKFSLDAALTTVVGLAMVFIGGVAYLEWYKTKVLHKIESAFARGFDPALQLADHKWKAKGEDEGAEGDRANWAEHMRRREQEQVDKIIHGNDHGHYFIILGPKGSGKTTMILDAMRQIEADGVAICEAHADLEVFRLRLGKALNFEYNEDSQTGLFQRRDPREGGPRLDIERALNKLEKVALRVAARRKKGQKPLVLVFNNIHLFQNNPDSQLLLLQLQQRAETWAESGIMTVVFSSDDFWPYPLLRKNGNRMQVLSVYDLARDEAFSALRRLRKDLTEDVEPDAVLEDALDLTGGRLSFISRIARSKKNVLHSAHTLLEDVKSWMLSQIGLIPDCDDDVMDEQKVCASSWLLLQEFVKIHRKAEAKRKLAIEAGDDAPDLPLPSIPYWRCRQIMTRADFLELLDQLNIVSIDIHHNVTPDSMLVLKAVTEVVEEEGFDELLDNVRNRIDAIESLHRTRELTWKNSPEGEGDRVRVLLERAK